LGVTASDDVDGTLTATSSKASGTVFPIGTTTVTCSASDKAGHRHYRGGGVPDRHLEGDVALVAGAKTAIATSTNGAVVTYTAPTATDIVDGAVATTSDKASGSTFALGTTTVTCTAKNAAGNVHTKSFTVTVTAAWSNVLQPVNGDGSPTFKLGSTVPASNATTGNLFRYDATSAPVHLQHEDAERRYVSAADRPERRCVPHREHLAQISPTAPLQRKAPLLTVRGLPTARHWPRPRRHHQSKEVVSMVVLASSRLQPNRQPRP
jgi:hypothetical protein